MAVRAVRFHSGTSGSKVYRLGLASVVAGTNGVYTPSCRCVQWQGLVADSHMVGNPGCWHILPWLLGFISGAQHWMLVWGYSLCRCTAGGVSYTWAKWFMLVKEDRAWSKATYSCEGCDCYVCSPMATQSSLNMHRAVGASDELQARDVQVWSWGSSPKHSQCREGLL